MALASCSNESDNTDGMTPAIEGHQTTLTFTAGMTGGADTRTAIDAENGLKLLFQNNDQIWIQDGNLEVTDATAALPEGQTETSPTCSFTAPFGDGTTGPYTAFYPKSAYIATDGEPVSAGNLRENQFVDSVEDSFDPNAHIMTATTGSNQMSFLFQTRNAFLKFTAPCNLVTVILQGNNGEKIAGNFTIESDGSIKAADDAFSEITLYGPDEGKVYYIALIPTVFEKGVTVTLTNLQDEEFTYRTEEPVTFLPNKVNTIPAEKLRNLLAQ